MPTNHIAEVVLLQRLPRGVSVFDYTLPSPTSYAVGDLVEVPFRNQTEAGVIVKVKPNSLVRARLKTISQLLAQQYLNHTQLALTERTASYYGVAWATALKTAVPLLPNKRLTLAPPPPAKRVKRLAAKAVTIAFNTTEQRIATVLSLAKRVTERNQQMLILVPEISYGDFWKVLLAKKYRVATYNAEQKTTDQRAAWLAVRTGEANLIIATRAALFLPFHTLGGILVDYAENENYKQSDQNPRYDALQVASWLSNLTSASLAYLSPAPPLGLWWQSQTKATRWETLSSSTSTNLDVIDLTHEHQSGSKGIVSYTLAERITEILQQRGKVFLYLNRRGSATGVTCRDCGFTPTCKTCQRTLVWSAASNKLHCYHCGLQEPIPLPCPTCWGSNLRYVGAGLERLEQELKQQWPNVTMVTLEGEVSAAVAEQVPGAQIILGSRAAWRYLNFKNLDLVAALLPDTELSLPEYRAAENVWSTVRFFLTSGAKSVVVQTWRPEHYLWSSLRTKNISTFYKTELRERGPYNYPPYNELLRLTTQSLKENQALEQAQQLATTVKQLVPASVSVTGPYADYYHQVRGQYRFHVLLRYTQAFKPEVLWPHLPDAILIDRQPRSVLR